MDNNQIEYLDDDILEGLDTLEILGLGWNKLKVLPNLPESVKIKSLYMLGNPLPDNLAVNIRDEKRIREIFKELRPNDKLLSEEN